MDNIPVGGQPCAHCHRGANPVFTLTVDTQEVTTTDGRTLPIAEQTSVCQACLVAAMIALLRASPIPVKAAVFATHLAPAAPPQPEEAR